MTESIVTNPPTAQANFTSQRLAFRRPAAEDANPRRYERRRNATERLAAILLPLLLLGLWEGSAQLRLIDVRYFPPPSSVLVRWGEMIRSGEYAVHLLASLSRIVQGYVLGATIGLVFGTLLGSVRLLRKAFEPTLMAFNTIPKLAILPLLLLIFGIGELTKVVIVCLSTVFVVLLSTLYAVSNVPQSYRETARSFGANRLRVLLHVDLPAALPHIFTGLRLAASIAVVVIVGAEFVAAREGLGFLVWNAWSLGIPRDMYIGIISMAVLGVLITTLLQAAHRLIAPWDR